MLSEGRTNVSKHFPNFSENFRRYSKIAEEDPKMFRLNIDLLWLIQHWNRANLSENVSKSISSHVKITCYFHVWRYVFFVRNISWYFTDVYIIISTFWSSARPLLPRTLSLSSNLSRVRIQNGARPIKTRLFAKIRLLYRLYIRNILFLHHVYLTLVSKYYASNIIHSTIKCFNTVLPFCYTVNTALRVYRYYARFIGY